MPTSDSQESESIGASTMENGMLNVNVGATLGCCCVCRLRQATGVRATPVIESELFEQCMMRLLEGTDIKLFAHLAHRGTRDRMLLVQLDPAIPQGQNS